MSDQNSDDEEREVTSVLKDSVVLDSQPIKAEDEDEDEEEEEEEEEEKEEEEDDEHEEEEEVEEEENQEEEEEDEDANAFPKKFKEKKKKAPKLSPEEEARQKKKEGASKKRKQGWLRQTFIFSATLTISQDARTKIGNKKRKPQVAGRKQKKQKGGFTVLLPLFVSLPLSSSL